MTESNLAEPPKEFIELYKIAFQKLNQEGDGIWARFNYLMSVCIALAGGYVFALKELSTKPVQATVLLCISLFGLFASGWTFRTLRGLWWRHDGWARKVLEIESKFPDSPFWVKVLTNPNDGASFNDRRSAKLFRGATQPLMAVLCVGWSLAACYAGFLAFTELRWH